MHMTRKVALLDFQKCRPEKCEDGICAASLVCPSKLLHQESPYTVPLPEPSACRACGDCTRACPQKAIQLVAL
jgi:translation initiation factor RLI1